MKNENWPNSLKEMAKEMAESITECASLDELHEFFYDYHLEFYTRLHPEELFDEYVEWTNLCVEDEALLRLRILDDAES